MGTVSKKALGKTYTLQPYLKDHLERRGVFSSMLLVSLQDNALASQYLDGNNAKMPYLPFGQPYKNLPPTQQVKEIADYVGARFIFSYALLCVRLVLEADRPKKQLHLLYAMDAGWSLRADHVLRRVPFRLDPASERVETRCPSVHV